MAKKITRQLTEQEIAEIARRAAVAGAEQYRKESERDAKKKTDRMLYKTKVLLEKYHLLMDYVNNSVYTLEQAERVNPEINDIELLMKYGILDEDKTLKTMERSITTVNLIMTHVNRMLEIYRSDSEGSASPTRQRQWRVVYHMYLADQRLTTKEIADMEHQELRTIQNDAKAAREDLTVLFFGLNGILIRMLKD